MGRQTLLNFLDAVRSGYVPHQPRDDRLVRKVGVFANLVRDLATLSRCKRPGATLGCVVISPSLTEVLAIGYNGPPAGLDNESCRGPGAVGSCGCAHCEANALVKLRGGGNDLILLSTASPCEQCAGLILNSGRVRWVMYETPYRDPTGLQILERGYVWSLPLSRVRGEKETPGG